MAVRIHAVAAHAAAKVLDGALVDLPVARRGTAGPWCWAGLSVHAADPDEIDGRLVALGAPAFRFTTTDAAGWSWSVFNGSGESHHGNYWFVHLSKEVDRGLGDRQETGDVALLAALHRGGLLNEVDQGAIARCLDGTEVTEYEFAWDVGNLPRFLDLLGVDGLFPDWRDDMAAEQERLADYDAWLQSQSLDPIADVRSRLRDCEPFVLEGGSIELPVDRLADLHRITSYFKSGVKHGLSISADDHADRLDAVRAVAPVAGVRGDRLEVLMDNNSRPAREIRSVLKALGGLAPGSVVEFLSGSFHDDGSHEADQWYRGQATAGGFRIDETFPRMTATDLEGALDLIDQARAEKRLLVRDPEEAQAVINESPMAIWFFYGPPKITADGTMLTVERPDVNLDGVVEFLFHRRYGHLWDARARADWQRRQAKDNHPT